MLLQREVRARKSSTGLYRNSEIDVIDGLSETYALVKTSKKKYSVFRNMSAFYNVFMKSK